MAKKKSAGVPPKLTETELDLLTHLENGYQLETDGLGANPVLRRAKDDEGVRPASVNRNTLKVPQERGLIESAKGDGPLTIVWHLTKKAK